MATVKSVSYVEQNINMVAGVFNDTTIYSTAAPMVVRVGRDVAAGGLYVDYAIQTASNQFIILDTFNAFHGATVTVKRLPATLSTSIVTVVNGSAAGGTVGLLGTSTAGQITAVFDGVSGVWK